VYTLVLMASLNTAPATPQFDGFFRDLFRGGCNGSCTGRGSSRVGGCQGSCNGCCGGLFQGRVRNFFSDLFDGGSCRGCNGSCHSRPRTPDTASRPYDRGLDPAYAGGGCTGSMPYAAAPYTGGCTGGMAYGGCVGSTPLYLGSCFGSTPNYSCFGSGGGGDYFPPTSVPGMPSMPFGDYAPPQSAGFAAGGCNCGTGGTMGVPDLGGPVSPGIPRLGTPLVPDYPTIPSPGLPNRIPDGFDSPAQPRPAEGGGVTSRKEPVADDASRGKVMVRLPADATLSVEGRPLTVSNGERTFVTPPLPADREAVYTFKVEWTRDGETLSRSKKVRVKAGEVVVADFADGSGNSVKADPPKMLPAVPTESVKPSPADDAPKPPAFDSRSTAKPTGEVPTVKLPAELNVAKITVKLPAGATLFVNGGKNERTELVREFTTPPLTPGKGYQYTMRAEISRNGLPEYQESKVDFRAGDALTVDFTSLADSPAERRAGK
jgi:uncharacterized protein (TIGR03000 family)